MLYDELYRFGRVAITGLKTPKFINFWYCNQFYNNNGLGPIEASTQVDFTRFGVRGHSQSAGIMPNMMNSIVRASA